MNPTVYLDYEKIGKTMREADYGVFVAGAYVANLNFPDLREEYKPSEGPSNTPDKCLNNRGEKSMRSDKIEAMRQRYPKGTRVRLENMSGETHMPPGMEGDVFLVDDAAQIHVQWDNGSTLALIPGEDSFSVIRGQEQSGAEETPGMAMEQSM